MNFAASAAAKHPFRIIRGDDAPFDPRNERRIRYRCPTCREITTEIWPAPATDIEISENLIDCTCDECEAERSRRTRMAMWGVSPISRED